MKASPVADPNAESLDTALEEFKGMGHREIKEAIQRKLQQLDTAADLDVRPDDELLEEDAATKSRLVYVVSLLRLLEFLRTKPLTWDAAEAQGRLALGYIKHAETRNLAVLQLGRTKADEKLAARVAKVRKDLDALAGDKAKFLVRGRQLAAHKAGSEGEAPPGGAGPAPGEGGAASSGGEGTGS